MFIGRKCKILSVSDAFISSIKFDYDTYKDYNNQIYKILAVGNSDKLLLEDLGYGRIISVEHSRILLEPESEEESYVICSHVETDMVYTIKEEKEEKS